MSLSRNMPMTEPLYQGKFNPSDTRAYKMSRTKVELFVTCPRCFYLDRRLDIKRPPSFPFNLNSAVDHLLKKEFDIYRSLGQKHPLQEEYNIDAIPFHHKDLDIWRDNFKGVSYLHPPTGFHFFGALDDVWINSSNELIAVDYKATSKNEPIVALNKPWQDTYKRQMEFYQWLLRKNGFPVSHRSYFVYCNGKRSEERFNQQLQFDIRLIPYDGNDSWVEGTLLKIRDCLCADELPPAQNRCEYCQYLMQGKSLYF